MLNNDPPFTSSMTTWKTLTYRLRILTMMASNGSSLSLSLLYNDVTVGIGVHMPVSNTVTISFGLYNKQLCFLGIATNYCEDTSFSIRGNFPH